MTMNAPVLFPGPTKGTQAAEGLLRRAFSVAEIERMVECGILHEDDRLELIGGELVVMPAKGIRHETLKVALTRFWASTLPRDVGLAQETTFRLSPDTFLEPDFVFWRKPVALASIAGDNVLLVAEVADGTLGYDLHRKPAVFSRFGVRELWVIDAVRRDIHVHREPGEGGYAKVSQHGPAETVTASLAPEVALCLDQLDADWSD